MSPESPENAAQSLTGASLSSMLQGLDLSQLDSLPKEQQKEVQDLLSSLGETVEQNPLYGLRSDNEQQVDFLRARSPIQAAFCGNRFGKTTALIVKTLIQVLDEEWVPEWLREFKVWYPGVNTRYPGVKARLLCPSFQNLETVLLAEFRKWTPRAALKSGKWSSTSFNKQVGVLHFDNGSFIEFKTYQQDPEMMAGASLHFVGYDEPPPWEIRRECRVRLTDYPGSFEMFTMTPLKANTAWVRREIYKKREHPDITVVRGSMWDNPTLSKEEITRTLESQPDHWRAAVEYGDFIDIGGLVYPEFERAVRDRPYGESHAGGSKGRTSTGWSKWYTDQTRWAKVNPNVWDVVVGIDPGIRNCGIVWCGFDKDNTMFVFDEALLQDKTAADYVETIKKVNSRWGIKECLFVIDPASRQRAQVNSDTVQTELLRRGIPTVTGQNDVEAGCMQIRTRLQHQRLFVNPACRGLRDEADDYALEDREDGVFKPLKGNDHRMDALRYVAMARAWDPIQEAEAPKRNLGYVPDQYDPEEEDRIVGALGEQYGPMGAYS